MGWRGPATLALLLAVGAAGGYATSGALADPPRGSGVAEPVVARSPSIPVDPATPAAPDPDDEALQPGIPLTTESLGRGRSSITYPVPEGWRSTNLAANEVKWKQPGTSNNTYVMRIEQMVSQDLTIPQATEARVAKLEEEQDAVRIVARGPSSLEYTYRSDEGTARHTFMRWLDLSGSGLAEVEIVVHGRERDVPGTRELVRRVAEGMRAG